MKLKHLFLVLLAQMFSMTAFAYDAEIDGIYYNYIISSEAEVTSGEDMYTGDIVIPETVTYNGITYSVTSIDDYAFFDCSGLTSVTIPGSVTSIGERVFAGCSGLTSIAVENGNTVYDSRDNCNAIINTSTNELIAGCKNTTIPGSVTSIGREAFYRCRGLTSVTIPGSVTSIGREAFCSCQGLTSVVAKMTTPFAFGGSAFVGISSSCVLTVPKGTCDAYIAAGWTEEVFMGGIVEMEGEDKPDNIVFADANVKAICVEKWDTNGDGELSYAEAAAVTDIGQVSKGNQNITSFDELQYFTSLTSIGYMAFDGCSNLTSVIIPNSVTSIGDYTFRDCNSLTSVTIPGSVTSIGYAAFSDCSSLTSVTIPGSVTSIGGCAFAYSPSLTSVTIPGSVTSIGNFAFGDCPGLTSISVDNGNTVYDSRDNCIAIIETASNTLIAGCMNTVIPNSVTSIGECAFSGCSGLTSVTIPNSVTSIGDHAFAGCGLTSVTIPNNVTSIGTSTFAWCSNLTSITFPNSVMNIGNGVFFYCSSLTDVYSYAESVPTTGGDAFDGSSVSSATLHVPAASLETYKVTEPWNTFGTIVAIDDPIEDKTHEIVMERKYLVHHGGSYNYPRVFFEIDNKRVLSIGYYDARYWRGSYSNTINGIYIVSGDGHEESHEEWYIAPVIQDEWVTEKLIVNSDGHVQYYMDEQYMGEVFFEELKMNMQNATSMVVAIDPWGWWDGHYMYMDDFKLTIDGTVIIDDDFNDGIINLDSWQSPVNPDGVREEDGIMKMEQLRTDQDFYLRSLPIPLKSSGDDNDLDMADANIKAGESNIVEIGLTNGHADLVAFQMDLTLPEGVSIDKIGCALSSRITDEEQTLTVGKLESGAYRITSTSFSLTPISGNDGTLFSLKLTAEDGCIGGQATIKNVIFSTSESEKVIMSDKAFDISILYNLTYTVEGVEYQTSSVAYGTVLTPEAEPTMEGYTFGGWSELPATMPNHDVEVTGRFYLYGDVNTDEAVDVVDVVDIARFVVATPSVNFREKLADLNYDSTINIADAVTLVNYIAGDQNFVKAEKNNSSFYDYSQCQLQLLSGENNLSLRLSGEADFTAFQFEVEVPENTDISAMRINGMRNNGHKLLFNKVADNRYRVAALSLTNATFKGEEGELLNICIEGLQTDDASIHGIHFVTTKGHDITFDSLYISGIETGIVNVGNNGNNPIYDLQGRRRSTLQRGLNIVGGKTILNK